RVFHTLHFSFFSTAPPTTDISPLSLHDALPILENTWLATLLSWVLPAVIFAGVWILLMRRFGPQQGLMTIGKSKARVYVEHKTGDRKSTRLNSSHLGISYAVFCLKKKKKKENKE